MAIHKIIRQVTAYPAANTYKRSQRTPYSFIDENTSIDNIGGAVLSNGSASQLNRVRSCRAEDSRVGSQIINSEESGSGFISGVAAGDVQTIIKDGLVHNSGKNNPIKFTKDISAIQLSGIVSTAGEIIVPARYDIEGRANTKYFEIDVENFVSVPTDTNEFNNVWTYQDPSDDIVFAPEYGGSMKIETTLLESVVSSIDQSIAIGSSYILTIEIPECINFNFGFSVSVYDADSSSYVFSEYINTIGTHVIKFTPTGSTSQAKILFATEAANNNNPIYIKNIRMGRITKEGTNINFGNQTDVLTFANSKSQAQRVW